MNEKNAQLFLIKANNTHNNKYTYDLVEYVNSKTKVSIGCRIHGIFTQIPEAHARGQGCPICANNVRLTTEQFIEKAILIHGDRYLYTNTKYISRQHSVDIICKQHGVFTQSTGDHLSGYGCIQCAGTRKLTTEQFIARSILVHGDVYDYSTSMYVNSQTGIDIICKQHGVFNQQAYSHMVGIGCSKCCGTYKPTTKEFIEQANIIHNNKYTYTNTNYINNNTDVYITCDTHGDFSQQPAVHLNGCGCNKCNNKGYSQISIQWLEEIMQAQNIYIQHAENIGEYKIPNTRYRVDGYHNDTNTIYEFYGDYFHGNPNIYDSDHYNKLIYKTMGELYQKTIDRENTIKELGYNIISVWYSDYIITQL